jgi:hypothetical protein
MTAGRAAARMGSIAASLSTLAALVTLDPVVSCATLVAGVAAVAGKRARDAARNRAAREILDGEDVEQRVAEHLGYAVARDRRR